MTVLCFLFVHVVDQPEETSQETKLQELGSGELDQMQKYMYMCAVHVHLKYIDLGICVYGRYL